MSFRRLSSLALFAFAAAAFVPAIAQAQSATYSVVSNFTDGSEGGYPVVTLMQGSTGNFYGVTSIGGTNGAGVIFQMTQGGALSGFYNPPSGGALPEANLIEAGDGNFYGVASSGGDGYGSVFKLTPAGALSTVHTFANTTDGSYPSGPLVQGSDGNLYGVTSQGGNLNDCEDTTFPNGCGTVFKVTLPSGTFSTLYTFTGSVSDGGYPGGGLIQGADGNFYGTNGVSVYQVTTAGKVTIIATSNETTDGVNLLGPLAQSPNGSFYGSTENNGTGCGTLFKASASGGFTLLHSFNNAADGCIPLSGVYQGTDGNFYGTTSEAGNDGCAEGFGCGTIYQVTPSGTFTVLYTFGTQSDGILGGPGLTAGNDGRLYGTAGNGGNSANCNDGCGTVFALSVSPKLTSPVVLSPASSSVNAGTPYTLSWTANNAYSVTSQQCYAFGSTNGGAGAWTGKQTGTYSSSTHNYTGSASLTPTTAGTYTLALTCGGTVSGFATVKVTGNALPASTTKLSVSPTSLSVGQPATLKATVTGSGSTPTGSVTFAADGATLATVNLASGVASLTASSNGLPPATYPVIATYSGSSSYSGSASSATNVTLSKAPTSTALSVTPTSVTPPATVTLKATVKRTASGATGTPTGSVTFYADGSVALATVNLNSSGVASLTASSNGYPAANYTITAKYSGDTYDTTSTSSGVTVTVK
jgi:uncharacterized repeat protein (TIGR03803 family)